VLAEDRVLSDDSAVVGGLRVHGYVVGEEVGDVGSAESSTDENLRPSRSPGIRGSGFCRCGDE
jgi:hypothetical protein